VLVAPAYTYSGVGGSNSLEDLASLERFQPDNVEMDPASLNSLNDLDTKHLVIPGAAYSSPNALDQPQPYFRESVAHSHGSINSIEQSGRSPKNGPGYAGLLLPGAAEAGSPSGDVVLRRSARGSAGSRLSTGSPPSRSSASEVGSHHTVPFSYELSSLVSLHGILGPNRIDSCLGLVAHIVHWSDPTSYKKRSLNN